MSIHESSVKNLIPEHMMEIWYFDNGKIGFTVRVMDGLVVDHENESLESFQERYKKEGFTCEHANK